MKIIIIGDGKVGYSLAENLSKEEHEITIIDKNIETLHKTVESLDVMCICGNGVSTGILERAGVREADLLIAATSGDEMNMVCSLTAKKLGVKHTVARIRDTQYADELSQIMSDMGLDLVMNPERAVAGELARMLQFPPAIKVETFAYGKAEMVEIRVGSDLEIVGMPLKNIMKKFGNGVLIGAILRGKEAIIPNGESVVLAGDILYFVGKSSSVYHFCKKIGIHIQKIKNAMIIGGGRVAYYLARHLADMAMKTKIIEINERRCEELAAQLPGALIIHGDGSDESLLQSEQLGDMEAFISITGHDEDNLMTALLAKQAGVRKVAAKISRMSYTGIIQNMGIDHIVNPKLVTADSITQFVRGLDNAMGNPVHTLYRIVNDQVEALEFTVGKQIRCVDIALKNLRIRKGIVIAAITRKGETIIPHGNDRIQIGDSVIIFAKGIRLSDLHDILEDNSK